MKRCSCVNYTGHSQCTESF